tara:strand:- start:17688 stop:19940 length:2253 start_codon:yes stop_codon:yes gene_type:complete
MAEDQTPSDPVMREALDHFEESESGTTENRTNYKDDTKFARMGNQWPDTIKKQREQESRPVLTINKLPAFIRSVVNESRQNKPGIKVGPVDNGADEDTAEVIGGLIRSIERNSTAEVAYDTAIDHAVTGGFGFFRIAIDYAHDETFDLEALIQRIPNALMVHWDASSSEFDASDWEYAFISELVGKREFERRYPKASKTPFDGDNKSGLSEHWVNDDDIRVSEYFLRVAKTRKLLQLSVPTMNGGGGDIKVVREDQLPTMAKHFFRAGQMDKITNKEEEQIAKAFLEVTGVQVMKEREVEYHEVTRRILNGVEVLEEEDWPGSLIPVCPVWGDEVYDDGKRYFMSMIRDSKDPQRMFNFWRSASTELVALAPKAPWVGPVGFVPVGEKTKWENANTRSHQYLEYDPDAGAAPRREPFAGVPAGALQEALNANDDMKSIMGVYDPSLGAEANEKSGVAIRARQRQGDTANFHFIDNLSRAIGYCGRCLVEIIPAIYSARSTIRILGEDQKENVVELTQQAGSPDAAGPDGARIYNLATGKYDVTVASGPSFATQREETRETLIEIMRQVPDAAAFLGDVLLDHMDFVGADKVAKRLKGLLPPGVRQAEEAAEGGEDPKVAQLQQQLQAQGQEFTQIKDQVMAEIQKLQAELEKEKADNQAAQTKTTGELALKDREIDLKSRELDLKAQQPVETVEERQAFEARQNERDRQVDLAKAIINKAEPEDTAEDMAGAADKAMGLAGEMLGAPPGD